MAKHYQIIEVTGGKVLTAHDVLASVGIDCLSFVEIKRRTPFGRKRQERGDREAFALSAFSRYLFADLSAVESLMKFGRVMCKKKFIHGVMGNGERLYSVKGAEFDGLRSITHETGRYKGKAVYLDYDRATHNRKVLNRIYGQSMDIPEFTEGDIVSFIEGGMRGLIYQVDSVDLKGKLTLKGEQSFFGGVDLIKIENPYLLEKVA